MSEDCERKEEDLILKVVLKHVIGYLQAVLTLVWQGAWLWKRALIILHLVYSTGITLLFDNF